MVGTCLDIGIRRGNAVNFAAIGARGNCARSNGQSDELARASVELRDSMFNGLLVAGG